MPRRLLSGRELRLAAAQVPLILAQLAGCEGTADAEGWATLAANWTITGTATFLVGRPGGPPEGVLRLSCTGGRRLQHESEVLQSLAEDPGLAKVVHLIPSRRAQGVVGNWCYGLDEYLPGVDAPDLISAAPQLESAVLESSIAAVTALHRATVRPVVVDEQILQRWVETPVAVLSRALRGPALRMSAGRLDALRQRLTRALAGRELLAGWTHGDFWLGNVRVDPVAGTVTGLIDWDCADCPELPAHDLLHLALYGSSLRRGASLGRVVAEAVSTGTWSAECESILRHSRWGWEEQLSDADVALLYWLRYTAVMIEQQRDYVHHSILAWEWRNVVQVLRAL